MLCYCYLSSCIFSIFSENVNNVHIYTYVNTLIFHDKIKLLKTNLIRYVFWTFGIISNEISAILRFQAAELCIQINLSVTSSQTDYGFVHEVNNETFVSNIHEIICWVSLWNLRDVWIQFTSWFYALILTYTWIWTLRTLLVSSLQCTHIYTIL